MQCRHMNNGIAKAYREQIVIQRCSWMTGGYCDVRICNGLMHYPRQLMAPVPKQELGEVMTTRTPAHAAILFKSHALILLGCLTFISSTAGGNKQAQHES